MANVLQVLLALGALGALLGAWLLARKAIAQTRAGQWSDKLLRGALIALALLSGWLANDAWPGLPWRLLCVAIVACATALAWYLQVLSRKLDTRETAQLVTGLIAFIPTLACLLWLPGIWKLAPLVALPFALALLASAIWHVLERGSFPPGTVDVVLTTEDGLRIAGYHSSSGRSDLLIVTHSIGASARRKSQLRLAERLSALADALHLDVRGHGASEGKVDGFEWRDVEAAVTWARAQGYARVHLLGFSIGAMAVLRVASTDRDIASVAAVSPLGRAATLRKVARYYMNALGRLATRLQGGCLARPEEASLENFTVGEAVAGSIAPTPLLVISAERDLLFGGEDGLAVYEAAKEPKTLRTHPTWRHGPLVLEAFEDEVSEAIERHLREARAAREA